MLLTYLFILNSVIWQEDFTTRLSTMSQLYEYRVDITHMNGKVLLKANPRLEGSASAWYYLEEYDNDFEFSEDDVLELAVKVNDNKLRLNYYYHRKGYQSYWAGEKIISADEEWQTIKIPLKDAKPFYSGNFPYALTPGRTPALFIFIDNLLPGDFEVEIDRISVLKEVSGEEE